MKKSCIFLLLIFCKVLDSFSGNPTHSYPTKKKLKTDSTGYNICQKKLMNVNDSMLFFPAYDTYCEWDTVSIHPGHYDFCNIDSIHVLLNDTRYCGYVHPFDGSKSSDFGYRRGKGHYGVDINLETGDPVVAAFEGKVRIAMRNKSYGNVVVIRHNNGLETFYAHLSKLKVRTGEDVDAGEIIGLGGNTGHSYGSHLHFEVRYMGIPLNPNNLISFDDKKLLADSYLITRSDFDYLDDATAKKASMKKSNRYRAAPAQKGSYIPRSLNTSSEKIIAAPTSSKSNASISVKTNSSLTKPKSIPAKNGSRIYVVKKGDTLYKIAKTYGTTTANICKLNNINTNTTLSVGRKLKF